MAKRSAADRRKRANMGAQARQPGQQQSRQTQPHLPDAPQGRADASPMGAGAPQPASTSQPLTSDVNERSKHSITVAAPPSQQDSARGGPETDESLVRRFFLTDEEGNLLRRPRPLREQIEEWLTFVMPFSLRERDWGTPGQLRTRLVGLGAIVAALVLALVAGMVVFHLAQNAGTAVGNLPAPQPTQVAPKGIVVQAGTSNAQPTPAFAPYLIGAWVSNSAPAPSSTIQVYVRVSTSSGPAANVPVSVSVQYGGKSTSFGTKHTDAYGLASFAVPTGTGDGAHVDFVTASTQIKGKTYTAQTSFTPY